MPMVQDMLESESGLKVDRSLSADESVAHGAAIYAGILLSTDQRLSSRISVHNVNSHDLGLLGLDKDTGGQRRSLMIPRNSRLPAKKGKRFATSRPNQASVSVKVVEGGDDTGRHSTLIGNCVVRDLPANLPAATAVDVFFNYGDDGRLHVTAALPSIGTKAEMTIERESGLSNQDLEYWTNRVNDGLHETQPHLEPRATGFTPVTPGRTDSTPNVNVAPAINITTAQPAAMNKPSATTAKTTTPAVPRATPSKTAVTSKPAAPVSAAQTPVTAKASAMQKQESLPESLIQHPPSENPPSDAPAAGSWKTRRQQIKPGDTE